MCKDREGDNIMDKTLVLKILGKKDSVDLGDQIYNLRGITEELRKIIILKLDITEAFANRTSKELKDVYDILKLIKDRLEEADNISGYTNSRKFLLKFVNNLCININGIINSINPINVKDLTYYSNTLIDLVLMY